MTIRHSDQLHGLPRNLPLYLWSDLSQLSTLRGLYAAYSAYCHFVYVYVQKYGSFLWNSGVQSGNYSFLWFIKGISISRSLGKYLEQKPLWTPDLSSGDWMACGACTTFSSSPSASKVLHLVLLKASILKSSHKWDPALRLPNWIAALLKCFVLLHGERLEVLDTITTDYIFTQAPANKSKFKPVVRYQQYTNSTGPTSDHLRSGLQLIFMFTKKLYTCAVGININTHKHWRWVTRQFQSISWINLNLPGTNKMVQCLEMLDLQSR